MVGCGEAHTVEVMEEGGLWSWSMGVGGEDRLVPVRVEVEELDEAKIVSSACEAGCSVEVKEDGALCT